MTRDTIDEFLDGLDIVVEECDSLDVKAIVRRSGAGPPASGGDGHQRPRPDRRRALRSRTRAGRSSMACSATSTRQRWPDWTAGTRSPTCCASSTAANLSARGRHRWSRSARRCRRGRNWPAMSSSARRRSPRPSAVSVWASRLPSGRIRLDVADGLDSLADPALRPPHRWAPRSPSNRRLQTRRGACRRAGRAAGRHRAATSQPWSIEWTDGRGDDPARSGVPVDLRRRIARQRGGGGCRSIQRARRGGRPTRLGSVEFVENDGRSPLTAVVELGAHRRFSRLAVPRSRRARNQPATRYPGAICGSDRRGSP